MPWEDTLLVRLGEDLAALKTGEQFHEFLILGLELGFLKVTLVHVSIPLLVVCIVLLFLV